MAYYNERSTYFSNPNSPPMLGLSGMNNSAGESSDSDGTPSGVQSTRDRDSCDDYFFESSSSISIYSSCSELCTSDESECLESDEELENIRSNCSPSLVLD